MKKQNNNKTKTYLVAITGNIGVGKSLVGDILKEEGFFVIDTDEIVKEILRTKNPVTQNIVKEFGSAVVNNDDYYINKKNLASVVFSDKLKREKLESIVHPEVEKCLREIFSSFEGSFIFVLVPLLFECGLEKNYDESWCVICDKEIQINRLTAKGFTMDEIMRRLEAQMTQDIKAAKADFVINNSGTKEETISQIKEKINLLKKAL